MIIEIVIIPHVVSYTKNKWQVYFQFTITHGVETVMMNTDVTQRNSVNFLSDSTSPLFQLLTHPHGRCDERENRRLDTLSIFRFTTYNKSVFARKSTLSAGG